MPVMVYDEKIKLPVRPADGHKGSFGKVLAVCGSTGMAGAGYFAAKAAYRSGCGLVRILTPEPNRVIYQTLLPEALLALYETEAALERLIPDAVRDKTVKAVILGPGLGQDSAAKKTVRGILEALSAMEKDKAPRLVLDADGLNILAGDPALWELLPAGSVLTPHIMEMARLTGLAPEAVLADPAGTAMELAAAHKVILTLKSADTVITDGTRQRLHTGRNSALATGGSGDVLAGIIGGLLSQGMAPFEAAALGVELHGMAGKAAAERLTAYAVMAGDILDALPEAIRLKSEEG